MSRLHHRRTQLALALIVLLSGIPSPAKKKELPAVRWQAGAPGCTFEQTEDGHYRWRLIDRDLDMTLLMDPKELTRTRFRLYRPLGVYLSVTYTGKDKFDFPADLRMEFLRHHNVIEGFLDPTEFSTKMQNDVDTDVFYAERDIKKHPEKAEKETARERELQKEVAEFIEFLSTKSLEPAILNPGNPEVHGWVFFGTKNKWLGSWKSREDFILRVWMKDKIYEFPFSLPPSDGNLILRKRDE